jgi:hypothetical protein
MPPSMFGHEVVAGAASIAALRQLLAAPGHYVAGKDGGRRYYATAWRGVICFRRTCPLCGQALKPTVLTAAGSRRPPVGRR